MKYTLNEENISASTNIKEKTQSKLQWSCSEARRDDDDDGDDDDDDDEEEEEEEEDATIIKIRASAAPRENTDAFLL